MINISLPYIYNLSESLEFLKDIQIGTKFSDIVFDIWDAKNSLEGLINNSVFAASLRSCRSSAEKLIEALGAETDNQDFDREMQPHVVAPIQYAYREFKIAFLAEMSVFPSYFVTQKEPFDTLILLQRGVSLFPAELINKVPESQFDAMEAGKAMAFELSTACGFHLFRVVESVLRRYYTHVSTGTPHPRVRSITIYVKKMRSLNIGNENILSTLEQLAALHRNPLIHPEVALSPDEAISILGISRSAVSTMLAELPTQALTTTTAAIPTT